MSELFNDLKPKEKKVPNNIQVNQSMFGDLMPSEDKHQYKITEEGNRGTNLTNEDKIEPGLFDDLKPTNTEEDREDIDGDKIKDLFVSYFTDPNDESYPYEEFKGYWEKDNNKTTYFKGYEDGQFKFKNLGEFTLNEELKLELQLPVFYNTNISIHRYKYLYIKCK